MRRLIQVLAATSAIRVVDRSRYSPVENLDPRARPRRALALLHRHERRRVRCTPGVTASSRASPIAATTTSPSTAKVSGEDLTYFDQESNTHYTPYVIEPAAGADRATLAFLLAAYHEEEVKGEKRTVLRLDPRLAPVHVAVLPLSRNEKLAPLTADIAAAVRRDYMIDVDDAGSIGKLGTGARTRSELRCASPSTSIRSKTGR